MNQQTIQLRKRFRFALPQKEAKRILREDFLRSFTKEEWEEFNTLFNQLACELWYDLVDDMVSEVGNVVTMESLEEKKDAKLASLFNNQDLDRSA